MHGYGAIGCGEGLHLKVRSDIAGCGSEELSPKSFSWGLMMMMMTTTTTTMTRTTMMMMTIINIIIIMYFESFCDVLA